MADSEPVSRRSPKPTSPAKRRKPQLDFIRSTQFKDKQRGEIGDRFFSLVIHLGVHGARCWGKGVVVVKKCIKIKERNIDGTSTSEEGTGGGETGNRLRPPPGRTGVHSNSLHLQTPSLTCVLVPPTKDARKLCEERGNNVKMWKCVFRGIRRPFL